MEVILTDNGLSIAFVDEESICALKVINNTNKKISIVTPRNHEINLGSKTHLNVPVDMAEE